MSGKAALLCGLDFIWNDKQQWFNKRNNKLALIHKIKSTNLVDFILCLVYLCINLEDRLSKKGLQLILNFSKSRFFHD